MTRHRAVADLAGRGQRLIRRMTGVTGVIVVIGVIGLSSCSSSATSGTSEPSPDTMRSTSAPSSAPTTTTSAVGPTSSELPPATAPPSTAAAPTTTGAVTTTAVATSSTATPRPPAPPPTIAGLLALGRPIVLAHTGGEDEFPGSTMFSFGESMRAGVDMLDLNVVLTEDDVLVVQHDPTVDRLTQSSGAVAEMTAEQLAALDDAYWFTTRGSSHDEPVEAYIYRGIRTGVKAPPPGYTADDFAIPTLEDLIRRYPDVTLNIELKDTGERGTTAATELAKLLGQLGREDAAVVTSFDDATVGAFHAAAPNVEVSPGLGTTAAWVLDGTPLPAGMRILQLPPEFNGLAVLTAQSIAAAHDAGYIIWVWPNDPALENAASYDRFLAQGVDGLNINVPGAGVAAVRRFRPTDSAG